MLDAVVTQNIDRLHRKAGTSELVEVHGTIEHSSCLACGAQYPLDEVRDALRPPTRPACRAATAAQPLKPDVVLFGEFLPEGALERAFALAAGADVLLCIGSSLEVYPIAQLPGVTRQAGGDGGDRHRRARRRSTTPAAVKLDGDVVAELEALVAAL